MRLKDAFMELDIPDHLRPLYSATIQYYLFSRLNRDLQVQNEACIKDSMQSVLFKYLKPESHICHSDLTVVDKLIGKLLVQHETVETAGYLSYLMYTICRIRRKEQARERLYRLFSILKKLLQIPIGGVETESPALFSIIVDSTRAGVITESLPPA